MKMLTMMLDVLNAKPMVKDAEKKANLKNMNAFTPKKGHIHVKNVPKLLKQQVIYLCMRGFTIMIRDLSAKPVAKDSSNPTSWLCISEFIQVKNRSNVKIVTKHLGMLLK